MTEIKCDVKSSFEYELEELKEEVHSKMKDLCERYSNVKDWKIKFEYMWGVECLSWIDNDDSGWKKQLDDERSEGAGND